MPSKPAEFYGLDQAFLKGKLCCLPLISFIIETKLGF